MLPPEPCETELGEGATLKYFVFQNAVLCVSIYLFKDGLVFLGVNVSCWLLGLHLQIAIVRKHVSTWDGWYDLGFWKKINCIFWS